MAYQKSLGCSKNHWVYQKSLGGIKKPLGCIKKIFGYSTGQNSHRIKFMQDKVYH